MMSTQRPPNVILITTDQQRYDTLGVTGNPYVRTPNLDRLAARGTLFQHGYIQNPVCIPSRACIQTGRYVHQHGVEYMESEIGKTPGLPPWEKTFMERLQETGYTTAAYGKIHMMPPKGFDETALTMGKGARWTVAEGSPFGPSQLGPVYAEWLERKRPGAYESIYEQRRRPEYKENVTAIVNTLAADEYVDYWIGENTWNYLARDHDQPFFLWCGFCGPHGPFDPPEPYAGMYDPDSIPVPPLLRARQQNVPGGERATRFDREDGERLIRKIIAYYWGMMTFIDDMMGRI
ncbi:MAG TPA: sulfatase-like hydrolase/transferase, partial [Chloroflexota bacterium]|nr:sulfatase-like hydrolase/transferase [Chloroflexota bacterium]